MAQDIFSIRMDNYRTLVLRFQARPEEAGRSLHGALNRFAEFCGVDPRYLSHINNGRKKIGDMYARALEKGFDLPYGWLDNLHDSDVSSTSGSEKEFVADALRWFREDPVGMQRLMMRYLQEKLDAKK